jgi:hypothetical protein
MFPPQALVHTKKTKQLFKSKCIADGGGKKTHFRWQKHWSLWEEQETTPCTRFILYSTRGAIEAQPHVCTRQASVPDHPAMHTYLYGHTTGTALDCLKRVMTMNPTCALLFTALIFRSPPLSFPESPTLSCSTFQRPPYSVGSTSNTGFHWQRRCFRSS